MFEAFGLNEPDLLVLVRPRQRRVEVDAVERREVLALEKVDQVAGGEEQLAVPEVHLPRVRESKGGKAAAQLARFTLPPSKGLARSGPNAAMQAAALRYRYRA